MPLGSAARSGCVVVTADTAGAVPQFSDAEKEEIIVSVVDYLLELTDERVAYERAPFDHPEITIPVDARAPENVAGRGTDADIGSGGYTLLGQTGTACTTPLAGESLTGGVPTKMLSDGDVIQGLTTAGTTCFRQIAAVGAGGNPTRLSNFLAIASGPRLVGAAASCDPVDNHYCH